MTRVWTALLLAVDLPWRVVIAGLSTAWLIVWHRSTLSPAIVRLEYDGLSHTGAVLYACMLSLTPGTSAIGLDVARRSLLLHVLDGGRADRVRRDARRHLETRLKTLFPERPA